MPQPPRELKPWAGTRDFFGAEVRHWRLARGFTQDELGRLLLVSGDSVAKIEKAERWPPPGFAADCDRVLSTGGILARLLPLLEEERRQPLHSGHQLDRTQPDPLTPTRPLHRDLIHVGRIQPVLPRQPELDGEPLVIPDRPLPTRTTGDLAQPETAAVAQVPTAVRRSNRGERVRPVEVDRPGAGDPGFPVVPGRSR